MPSPGTVRSRPARRARRSFHLIDASPTPPARKRRGRSFMPYAKRTVMVDARRERAGYSVDSRPSPESGVMAKDRLSTRAGRVCRLDDFLTRALQTLRAATSRRVRAANPVRISPVDGHRRFSCVPHALSPSSQHRTSWSGPWSPIRRPRALSRSRHPPPENPSSSHGWSPRPAAGQPDWHHSSRHSSISIRTRFSSRASRAWIACTSRPRKSQSFASAAVAAVVRAPLSASSAVPCGGRSRALRTQSQFRALL